MWPKRFKLDELERGTNVFDVRYGWGKVVDKDTEDYTFQVDFVDDDADVESPWYNERGQEYDEEYLPTLFTRDDCPSFYLKQCPPPKRKVKKTRLVFINVFKGSSILFDTYEKAVKHGSTGRKPLALAVPTPVEWEEEE